ncbi:MAG: DUF3306 domain-containing protein [Ramlibacter sp.]
MTVVAMAEGFLGRWSRRKLDAREGKPPDEPAPPPSPAAAPSQGEGEDAAPVGHLPPAAERAVPLPSAEERTTGAPVAEPAAPLPTLEDVAGLTPDADFRRFVARGVAPEVRNAALKKLFADPHFNVMDRLDVYIDDYSQPDPIPESMLRQLASARFLGLFREEAREGEAAPGPSATTGETGAGSVAQSDAAGDATAAPPPDSDAHPDLRLQQDDAAEGGEPGRGAG